MIVTMTQWGIAALLAVFLVRRYVLLVASLLPRRPSVQNATRSIAILVAGRNEGAHVGTLLSAIDRLDYPRELVHVVLVSDDSTDDTAAKMRAWAATRTPPRSSGR